MSAPSPITLTLPHLQPIIPTSSMHPTPQDGHPVIRWSHYRLHDAWRAMGDLLAGAEWPRARYAPMVGRLPSHYG